MISGVVSEKEGLRGGVRKAGEKEGLRGGVRKAGEKEGLRGGVRKAGEKEGLRGRPGIFRQSKFIGLSLKYLTVI